ncbi:MAG: hypothetical protein GW779_00955 [Candidatus Altiarchaeum hamiconexum]|uniref:Uncharacterized protein n=1 Tax=Candidatus Altarchaeum hamiconexum TaxID=1803513 RepID=A0A8J7YVI3_9ARCH|nr:hypothetical protein [Candidatus Altarchaeum hamiconexum]NCN68264.1 hypothetical protein [Candidatus Altarchaeum hamiconexum]NCS90982.1 hypothetical protein [Candidatus Altarchaeum hamiconexum]
METVTLDVVNRNLKHIMKEIAEIKEYMVDIDTILTYDDMQSLREAENDLIKGKTKRLN